MYECYEKYPHHNPVCIKCLNSMYKCKLEGVKYICGLTCDNHTSPFSAIPIILPIMLTSFTYYSQNYDWFNAHGISDK